MPWILTLLTSLLMNTASAKQANIFLENGGKVNIEAIEKCFKKGYQSHECALHAIKMVKARPEDHQLALKMGNLIANEYDPAQALHVYQFAFTSSNQVKLCQNPLFQDSVAKALSVPAGELPKKANDFALRCWPAIQNKIVQELKEDEDGFALKNGCGLLKSKSALSGTLIKKCERSLANIRN